MHATEEGRPTYPWSHHSPAGIVDCVCAELSRMYGSLLLSMDGMWPATSSPRCLDLPGHDGLYPRAVSQSQPFLLEVALSECFITTTGNETSLTGFSEPSCWDGRRKGHRVCGHRPPCLQLWGSKLSIFRRQAMLLSDLKEGSVLSSPGLLSV